MKRRGIALALLPPWYEEFLFLLRKNRAFDIVAQQLQFIVMVQVQKQNVIRVEHAEK